MYAFLQRQRGVPQAVLGRQFLTGWSTHTTKAVNSRNEKLVKCPAGSSSPVAARALSRIRIRWAGGGAWSGLLITAPLSEFTPLSELRWASLLSSLKWARQGYPRSSELLCVFKNFLPFSLTAFCVPSRTSLALHVCNLDCSHPLVNPHSHVLS